LQVVGDFKHGSIKCVKLTNFLTYKYVDFNAGPRFVSVHCMSLFLAGLVYLAHIIHLFSIELQTQHGRRSEWNRKGECLIDVLESMFCFNGLYAHAH
jgi:hypothetical protein